MHGYSEGEKLSRRVMGFREHALENLGVTTAGTSGRGDRRVMKVLVTGTDGYIGALLAPLLLDRRHEVVGLDTGFYRDGWLYNNGIARLPLCINKDIRDITEEDLH